MSVCVFSSRVLNGSNSATKSKSVTGGYLFSHPLQRSYKEPLDSFPQIRVDRVAIASDVERFDIADHQPARQVRRSRDASLDDQDRRTGRARAAQAWSVALPPGDEGSPNQTVASESRALARAAQVSPSRSTRPHPRAKSARGLASVSKLHSIHPPVGKPSAWVTRYLA